MSASETMMFAAGGGDYDDLQGVVEQQDGDWETYDVTDLVHGYCNNTIVNNGFILLGNGKINADDKELEDITEGINYASSNASDLASRPKLTIEFQPVGTIVSKHSTPVKRTISLNFQQNSMSYSVAHQGDYSVIVVNAQGREVFCDNVQGAQTNVMATDGFSSGVYFMKVSGHKFETVEKFVIR